ncbi:hypothetical protein ASE35_19410 [Lysobacter sp. Root916]|uniref:phosphatidylinositol-specific phospholipase C/glycerophosphodiester phosphodiesterase family protein n=1 Tax=Lysobacter sp. Root916 TaxID=1736606 RepID=UPI00070FBB7E|nr:phosphatidylinositol-specific phospholipase C/glycerophosphodiester phosphodiesterase family protein [Lysobacter sp. Root916]KRD28670.1 hypothetical protein ASE35_19410 [Lysobacter sp. Root916]
MIIVRHRRNTRAELRATSPEFGIELDLRSRGDAIIIHHDAFADGEDFEDWLDDYRHRLLILNVKEEGLEDRLIALMRERGIQDWFFLDQSFPFLVRTAARGESRCAVRVSEYESIDTALSLAGRVGWVWVDCFTRFPLDRAQADRLRAAGFRLCLVSPELQGRNAAQGIAELRERLARDGIAVDAVCTKETELWR